MMPKNCNRCAYCCSMVVRISQGDISRIKKLGLRESDFADKDRKGRRILKRINDYCTFLEIKKGIGACTIYNSRPKRCADYPYRERCDLMKHYVIEEIA